MQELVEAEREWYAGRSARAGDAERRCCAAMKRLGFSDRQLADAARRAPRPTSARERHRAGRPAGVQDGGHLRRRVPVGDAVPVLAATTRRTRRAPSGDAVGRDPRQRPEPDRAGRRVRLLLRPRGDGASASWATRRSWSTRIPETVSTDFDISDKLYFEPLTLEDVLEIVAREQPIGVIVQLGGQTPLKLARGARGARACRSSAPRPTRSTSPRTAGGSRRSPASSASRSRRAARRRASRRRSRSPTRVGYPGAGAAVVRARRPRDGDRLRRRVAARATSRARRGWRRSTRC